MKYSKQFRLSKSLLSHNVIKIVKRNEAVASESSHFRLLKLLAKSYEDSPPSTEPVRHESSKHTNLSQRFYVKDKNFRIQYSHIYYNRLMLTRVLLNNKLKTLGVKPCKVIGINPNNEEVCVIGTLFKENKFKPSVLHRINEYKLEFAIEPGRFAKRTSKEDYMYLEDETGRLKLSFDEYQQLSPSEKDMAIVEKDYTAQELVTGLIAALIGKSDTLGTFFVNKILFCDVPKNENEEVFNRVKNEMKALESPPEDRFGNFYTVSEYMDGLSQRRTNGMGDEFIAIISGLNYSFEDSPINLKRLKQFFLGGLPGSNTRQFVSKISRVIFAGDIIKEEKELKEDIHGAFKVEETHAKVFQDMKKSFSNLDGFFADLSKSVNVDLMPGSNDPTDDTLPQQPLNRVYFPKAYACGNFNSMTNPYQFRIGDVNILGTSGINILDLMHYSEFSDKEIDIMEAALYWRQLAPTAPDTLKCYPFDKDDPFFIEELPHVFFAGNLRSFDTRLFYQEKSKKICRLITIPIFSDTGSIVIVNIKNLDTFEIQC